MHAKRREANLETQLRRFDAMLEAFGPAAKLVDHLKDSKQTIVSFLEGKYSRADELAQRLSELLDFIDAIDDASRWEYLRTICATGDVERLTNPGLFESAKTLGHSAIQLYFIAIAEIKDVEGLTAPHFMELLTAMKEDVACGYLFTAIQLDSVAELRDPAFVSEWSTAQGAGTAVTFPEHLVGSILSKISVAVKEDGEKMGVVLTAISCLGEPMIPRLLTLLEDGDRDEKILAGSALYSIGGPSVEGMREQIEALLQTVYPTTPETRERSKRHIGMAKAFGERLEGKFGSGNVIVTVIGSTQKGLAVKGSDIDCNVYIFSEKQQDEVEGAVESMGKKLMEENGVKFDITCIAIPSRSGIGMAISMANENDDEDHNTLFKLSVPYLVAHGGMKTAGEAWLAASKLCRFDESVMKSKYADLHRHG